MTSLSEDEPVEADPFEPPGAAAVGGAGATAAPEVELSEPLAQPAIVTSPNTSSMHAPTNASRDLIDASLG